MTTMLETLDELLALAAHAGMLGGEAIAAHALAYGKRDRGLSARARQARQAATAAEQELGAARARFLADTGAWEWSAEVVSRGRAVCAANALTASSSAAPESVAPRASAAIDDAVSAIARGKRGTAINFARQALRAVRSGRFDNPWAYFAEVTDSWWGVTEDSMVRLADMMALSVQEGTARKDGSACNIIDAWAEADSAAIELDYATQQRLAQYR